jgi:hypothetical protein
LGNRVWQSEEGQGKQCPKKEIKRQTMIYKTTAQKTRNLTIRISQNSYKQTKSVNNRKTVKTVMTLTLYITVTFLASTPNSK